MINLDFWPVVFVSQGDDWHTGYIRTAANGLRFVSYHSRISQQAADEILSDAEKMGIVPTKEPRPQT